MLVTQVSAKLIWKLFPQILEALEYAGTQQVKKPTANSSVVSNQLLDVSPTVCAGPGSEGVFS